MLAGCAGGLPPGTVLPITAEFSGVARTRATAVRLADGRLLSAAHILDDAGIAEGFCRLGRRDPPPLLSALSIGPGLPATRIRNGLARLNTADCELAYHNGADLALLAAPGEGGAVLCEADTSPGQPVLVATRDRVALGRMAGNVSEANPANGIYAVLTMRLEPGESGGGVFDAQRLCLHGIVSQRAPDDPQAAWVVRTSVIRAFLAGG